jgi:hypothetical protein
MGQRTDSIPPREHAMPLKVIGAGPGRTGTLSLKVALEQLGFAGCYHMSEVLSHPEHIPVWDAAARGEPVDWEALLRGYQATVDWPGCNFSQEYLRLYPEARVILTVRDPERWYDSARQTIYYVRQAFPRWRTPFLPRMGRFQPMLDRLSWVGMFHGRFEDRSYAIEVFNRHNEEVKRVVPKDRLLVYEVNEGWGALCTFLGVPVPEGKPFPRLNDAAAFRARIRRGVLIVRTVAFTVAGAVVLILAWLASRRMG